MGTCFPVVVTIKNDKYYHKGCFKFREFPGLRVFVNAEPLTEVERIHKLIDCIITFDDMDDYLIIVNGIVLRRYKDGLSFLCPDFISRLDRLANPKQRLTGPGADTVRLYACLAIAQHEEMWIKNTQLHESISGYKKRHPAMVASERLCRHKTLLPNATGNDQQCICKRCEIRQSVIHGLEEDGYPYL